MKCIVRRLDAISMVHTAVEVLLEVVKQAGSNRRRKLISYNNCSCFKSVTKNQSLFGRSANIEMV